MDEPILQFFETAALPANQQALGATFYSPAHGIASSVPRNPERTVALRKLLESREAAMRAIAMR